MVNADISSSEPAVIRDTRGYSWVVVACAAVLGLFAGFTAGRSGAGGAPGAQAIEGPHTLQAWLARAATAGEAHPSPELRRELAGSLAGDPGLRRELIEHYSREARRTQRVVIKDMLVATRASDLVAAGIDLIKRELPLARGAGFELLGALEPNAEALALARRAIANESDATALAGALMALQPLAPPAQDDARAILPRLVELTRHEDALVRAHAVQRIADWDKANERATEVVLYALSDEDRLVRQAAVGAVMLGQLRSDAVKLALLRVIADPTEDFTARGASLHALRQFSLTRDEQSQYLAIRGEFERSAGIQH